MFYWILLISFTVIINFSINSIIMIGATGPCVLVESIPSSLCIPLDVINEAFHEARHRVGLYEPYHGPLLDQHHMDQIDALGLAITETTRILAKKFNLNHHQIFHFMPKLDLSLTEIWKFCPKHFQHKVCELSRFRSLSGHCNNIRHPDWGATFVPFQNLLPPHHPDGISEPRGYEHGYLPSPRTVSSTMHRDAVVHDHAITVMLIAWGQIIDHDITLTGDTKDPYTLKDPECCAKEMYGHYHHNCFPIKLPQNDPFYSHYGQHCMSFARSLGAVRSDCRLGTRKAFNKISSFLDASFVYGSDKHLGKKLRLGKHGLLRSLPIFEKYGLKELLPLKIEEPDDGCIRHNPNVFCFLAGDIRVNEQLVLTVLHTIFMREHNRIARILGNINTHWNDERIFQETRQIIIAITQHITFNEFLPMILGKYVMHDYGLTLQKEDYWTGYDPTVDATAAEEFVTSAFRFGHSLLPQRIERWSHGHRFIGSEDLHRLIRQPYDVYRPGYVDTFILGMVNQLAQAMDEGVTEQVTTLLFKEPNVPFGMDLAAMNIQRGREHGVPGYTSYREVCGLQPISSWEDLTGIMRNDTIYRYKNIYKSPHDIDLWSGGVSELPGKGSLLGPTFSCIIARQFRALKYGDRFWYELSELASSFTPDQLKEIREIRLSRLLCDNSDDLKSAQIYAMVLPDEQVNPRVSCHAHIIPRIDLEKWREIPGVTDNMETVNEHLYDHPISNHATIEYQHEHIVEQTPHVDHAYSYGESPSRIPISEIYITTPEPPTQIHHSSHDDYPIMEKIFHKHRNYTTKIEIPIMEPNYGYHHDNYGNDYEMRHSGHHYHHHHHHQHQHHNSTIHDNELKQNIHQLNHQDMSGEFFTPTTTLSYPHEPPPRKETAADKGKTQPLLNTHWQWQEDQQHHHQQPSHSSSVGVNSYLTIPQEQQHQKIIHITKPYITATTTTNTNNVIIKKPTLKSSSKFQPFPDSPFPGWSGIFSPNPGYLVKQKFEIYKAPPYIPSSPPQLKKGIGSSWKGIIG